MVDTVDFDKIMNRRHHTKMYFYGLILFLVILFSINFVMTHTNSNRMSELKLENNINDIPNSNINENKTLYDNYISDENFMEKCENILKESEKEYVVCCYSDEYVYDCSDQNNFFVGEKICFQSNLQKMNNYYDEYYVCSYSDLIDDNSNDEDYKCFGKFDDSNYNNLSEMGFVPNKTGEFYVNRIFLYEDDEYEKNTSSENILLMNLKGVVIG